MTENHKVSVPRFLFTLLQLHNILDQEKRATHWNRIHRTGLYPLLIENTLYSVWNFCENTTLNVWIKSLEIFHCVNCLVPVFSLLCCFFFHSLFPLIIFLSLSMYSAWSLYESELCIYFKYSLLKSLLR